MSFFSAARSVLRQGCAFIHSPLFFFINSRIVVFAGLRQRLIRVVVRIVRIVDDWFQNWSLGLIFEARVGKGRILVCGVDLLTDTEKRPEAIQLIRSLTSYMASDKFTPNVELSVDQLRSIVK